MDFLGLLIYPVAFIFTLGVLVVFHEYGHYCVARWCGVKVLCFSVGFGKILWSKNLGRDKTQWAVSAVPLGGYVKMLDEREGEVPADELHRAFNRQSLSKRSLIVAAGPFANFLLAAVIYALTFWQGSAQPLALLDEPSSLSPAAHINLQRGDEILGINDQAIKSWHDFRWLLLQDAAGQDVARMKILDRHKNLRFVELPLQSVHESKWEKDPLEQLGLRLYRPRLRPMISKVIEGESAQRAGLRSGDEVVSIDNQKIAEWKDLVEKVQHSIGQTLNVQVKRAEQLVSVSLKPTQVVKKGQSIGQIGIVIDPQSVQGERSLESLQHFVSYPLGISIRKGIEKTWHQSFFTVKMIGRMLVGEVSFSNISGPVMIADYAGKSAQLGWQVYLGFLAIVSIGLGVMNLLPIPALDGGHLLNYALEVIWRKPLPEGFIFATQRIGIVMLLILTAFALVNDVSRIVS